MQELKERLDRLYAENNRPEFILTDPVQFPHRYKNKFDREIAAFLAATIAWGRRDMILKSAEKMFAIMGPSPHAFVMKGDFRKPDSGSEKVRSIQGRSIQGRSIQGRSIQGCSIRGSDKGRSIHRTFFEGDLFYFCRGLKACYTKFGSIENLFASAGGVWDGISLFRETMASGNSGQAKKPIYSKHIANPEADSACKRLNLALRWLIRREGPVDLGQWKKLSPAALFIPLDLHAGRTARYLGLLDRKANDKKAVISLTEKLREFCPEDPAKYDFALFGYSVVQSPGTIR